MSNVDVAAIAMELQGLIVGGRFDKAYQPEKESILLRFRRKGVGRVDLVFRLGRYVTVTRRPPENPDQPSMVAKILRMTLANGRVESIHQLGFDRVLRMDITRGDGRFSLVMEFIGDGNLLILDEDDTILLPMRGADYRARKLRRGERYQPPPAGAQPFELDVPGLMLAAQQARRDLVRFMAMDLGFGPIWAEELCLRSGLAKDLVPQKMDGEQWHAVHGVIQELAAAIASEDLTPAIVYRPVPDAAPGEPEAEQVDVVPMVMQRYSPPDFVCEEETAFHRALDTYFRGAGGDDDEETDPRQVKLDEAKAKVQRRIDQITTAVDEYNLDSKERHDDGDAIYGAFQQVQGILDSLRAAREQRSWQEIEATLAAARGQGNALALQVPELRPHSGTALIVIPAMSGDTERTIEIDLRLSVQENADRQYQASKRARSRSEGARVALVEAEARMKEVDAKGLDGFGAGPKANQGISRHFWFESYRWTVTPSGFLAVGGRSAGQNDAVVKKYLRDGDRYVHADVHGAPSVVVRPADGSIQEVPDTDVRLACQFAAAASRAWRQFGEASAYWVTPQQVSKTPRSGEFVPRGAWIVHGRRNTEAGLPMAWGIGIMHFTTAGIPQAPDDVDLEGRVVAKVIGGPPDCVAAWCKKWKRLDPGDVEPNAAAAKIAEELDVDIESVQQALPPGPVRLETA